MGGGVKPPIHVHCVFHAKRGGEGVQIACKIAYVLNGRPFVKPPERVPILRDDDCRCGTYLSWTSYCYCCNIM